MEGEWNVNIIGLLFDHLKELFPRYKLLTFQQQPEDNTKTDAKVKNIPITLSIVKLRVTGCHVRPHRIGFEPITRPVQNISETG